MHKNLGLNTLLSKEETFLKDLKFKQHLYLRCAEDFLELRR